ncbi:MAG TPA: energy transducer TonB [Blastocatellia bacterium]|nr:energy transducer TonB [Blastocatellia bacterium]HMX25727.1 energy transducer TonB [Blastocatellia bacterium]HMZ20928.1 energy transducer TonB [Blastocatellia bacterium]HNG31675.1 energy transducer TonB [Blastocatellia bacterium]
MKLRKQAFASFVCSLALAGNSFGVLAQDKAATQGQSGKVVVRTPDGQTKEFTLDGSGAVSVDQNGQQVRITRTGKEGTGQTGFVVSSGGAGTTFFSQDGATRTLQGQDFVFVNGQSGGSGGSTFSFVSSEMSFDTKQVKGAPFSAEIETETIQTLGDGNRIVRKSGGAIYRDSEGRTRRESTINAIGPFAGSDTARTITINDPVEGAIFFLEPNSRTARKQNLMRNFTATAKAADGSPAATPKKINVSNGVLQGSAVKKIQPAYPPVAKAAKASGQVQVQITISEEGKVVEASAISGHPLLRDAAVEAARQWVFKPVELSGTPVKVQGVLNFNFTLAGEEGQAGGQDGSPTPTLSRARMPKFETKEESLGKQTIEGVEAEGKRKTTIIPEGAIGNERAIEIVSESWYSPELQTTVMSKRNDPTTTGETIFRMTNIRRGNPDASLFQVPSDYTVKEGGIGGVGGTFGTGTFNVRVPKPDNQ